ncbi:MAG: SsrA-binding protein SmpB [Gemmatimonadetes bacterium]|jgi:SsrA-binding protein|nr:SsrA-binding protein SmpB [Gemmatimonadota bacterium]MBT7863421.1 SsrA-binding protein SmpB [Gemmatimonadota bacterium]
MAKDKELATDGGGVKLIAQNRRARHDYEIIDTFEAGLSLLGTEVKALREGKASLGEGYARLDRGEAFLYSVHIGHCEGGNRFNHDPERARKLLLHRMEIQRLKGRVEEKGLTLIPLKLYFRRGRAKVEVGVAKGKTHFDRRHDIAKRDADRAIDRALSSQQRGKE